MKVDWLFITVKGGRGTEADMGDLSGTLGHIVNPIISNPK